MSSGHAESAVLSVISLLDSLQYQGYREPGRDATRFEWRLTGAD